jgi:IclR family acetate operon transcriptional repressor
MKPGGSPAVKSAGRVLDLLERFGQAERPLSFIELSRDLRIPKSSLFHLLADLTARSYVEHLPDISRYRPGPALDILIRRSGRGRSLADLVTPVLRRLNERLNETNAYYVLKDNRVAVIATENGTQPLTYQMRVGDSAPLYTFSAGKVALSFYSEAELKYYFAHVKREPRTDRTLREEAAIRRQLKQIRITGFGYSRSELARGVVGTARAVTVDGALAGVLNISVPEARMDDRLLATIHEQLNSATAELSSILRRAGHHEIDRAIGHGHDRGVGVGADDAGHH